VGQSERVPDWLLERAVLGELSETLAAAVEELRSVDPRVDARLRGLADANEAFLAEHPADRVAAEIERRVRVARSAEGRAKRSRSGARMAWLGASAAVVAAGAALALLYFWPGSGRDAVRVAAGDRTDAAVEPAADRTGAHPGDTRVKGARPHLVVHRKRGTHAELLPRRARVAQGDQLQLSYVAASARYGVIFSIDGRGVVTVHFPEEPGEDTALEQEGTVHLAHSYRLDDAPGFERFFFVTSRAPIDVREVRKAADALAASKRARTAPLDLGGDVEQTSFLLRKDATQ